jgi:flagellar biosynthesis protein FlhG
MGSSDPRSPNDQAVGLRRMFAASPQRVLPIVANPHVAFSSVVLERVVTTLAGAGLTVLLVDAAQTSPPPSDLALVDLAACIEPLDDHTLYLPARGLPRRFIDTRGSAERLLQTLAAAAPQAEALLLHGDAADLVRVFQRADARPLLIAGDDAESVKHAYAAAKLFVNRCSLATFDLLLAAAETHPRAAAITATIGNCLERFTGAALLRCAVIDPAADIADDPGAALRALLAEQLALPALEPVPPHRLPSRSRDWYASTH